MFCAFVSVAKIFIFMGLKKNQERNGERERKTCTDTSTQPEFIHKIICYGFVVEMFGREEVVQRMGGLFEFLKLEGSLGVGFGCLIEGTLF
jgi:hypothetical protein